MAAAPAPAAPRESARPARDVAPDASTLPAASLTPEQWPTVSRSLAVSGLAKQFAQQAQLVSCVDTGRQVNCKFRVAIPALTEASIIGKAQDALAAYFGKPCRIETEVGDATAMTAASEDADAQAQEQEQAERAIHADPGVQALLKEFSGATIVPGSIRPAKKGSSS